MTGATGWQGFAVALVLSALVTAVMVPVSIRMLESRRVVDIPNHRSSHVVVTPRGAGLAQLPGFLAAMAIGGPVPVVAWVTACGFWLLGGVDDLRTLGAIRRLLLQLALAVAVVLLLMGAFPSDVVALPGLVLAAILVVVLVYAVNATNFMDGINGLSLAHGVVFGIAYGVILWRADAREWVPLAVGLFGISIAVLPWNWGHQARVFLGDSGSYLLGSVTGLLILASWSVGVGLIVAVAPFVVYLADTAWTLLVRAFRHESLMTAHNDHVYQRLVRQGWSHPRTATVVAAFSAAAALVAILVQARTLSGVVGVLVVVLECGLYLLLPALVARRIKQTDRPIESGKQP